MDFYKILNDENGLRYRRGINIDNKPMDPKGKVIEGGGIRFAREQIFAMLGYGPYIRKVTPVGHILQESNGFFYANEVILHKRRNLDVRRIKSLISEGADIHAANDRAIFWACNEGEYEVAKLLLELGAVPDQSCLHYACATGHSRIVRVLLDYGLEADDRALLWAESNEHQRIAKLLRKKLDK